MILHYKSNSFTGHFLHDSSAPLMKYQDVWLKAPERTFIKCAFHQTIISVDHIHTVAIFLLRNAQGGNRVERNHLASTRRISIVSTGNVSNSQCQLTLPGTIQTKQLKQKTQLTLELANVSQHFLVQYKHSQHQHQPMLANASRYNTEKQLKQKTQLMLELANVS